MVNLNELRFFLIELKKYNSTRCVREAIETLLKIHRNIFEDEENVLYRKIKIENPPFSKKVWSIMPARQFMLKCGWLEVSTPDGDMLVFNHDENLDDIIRVLIEYRFVAPVNDEWEEGTKIENLNVSQLREEELRRKAALERQKELEEFEKDKMYREQLARSVKAQIADDRKRNLEKYRQAAVTAQIAGDRKRNLQKCRQPTVSNQQAKSIRIRNGHSLSQPRSLASSTTGRRLGED